MASKILITGANGFLGSWLVDEAIAQNLHVYAGVRKTSNLQYLKDPRIHFFYYDFSKEDQLREKLRTEAFDYIVLNAGLTTAKDRATYFKVNASYVRKICKILLEEKVIPKKLILISSLASYGPANYQVKQILDSDSTPHPVTWYGESKLQAEQFIQGFQMIPYLIFRPTAVFGPRDTAMVDVFKAAKLGLSPKIGKGEMDASFIYVKDMAKLVIDAATSEAERKSYFVSDGKVYPIHDFNQMVGDILGKKLTRITIPFSIMKLAGFVSENIGKLRGTVPILNRNKVKEYFARSFAVDTDDLKKDFNFAPSYTLSDGLKETITWCQQNKLL